MKWNRFICPVDGHSFREQAGSLRCDQGHTYDLAREGYCNLLLVQQKASLAPGDSQEMVNARRRFLESGHYLPIAQKVAEIAHQNYRRRSDQTTEFTVLDAGSGEGYYLRQLQSQHPQFKLIGIDISKPAVKTAAKVSPKISWAVASNKQLPIQDESLDLILCMFGFPVWNSFSKVLHSNGQVLLIDAAEDHLLELREIIYPSISKSKPPSIEVALQSGFTLDHEESLRFGFELHSPSEIQDLLAMTPHAHRMTEEGKTRLASVEKLKLTADVRIRTLSRCQ